MIFVKKNYINKITNPTGCLILMRKGINMLAFLADYIHLWKMSKTSTSSKINFSGYAELMQYLDYAPISSILIKNNIIYYVNKK